MLKKKARSIFGKFLKNFSFLGAFPYNPWFLIVRVLPLFKLLFTTSISLEKLKHSTASQEKLLSTWI